MITSGAHHRPSLSPSQAPAPAATVGKAAVAAGATKRVSAISASDAMNNTAPAPASTIPDASAQVTIAAITAMYATSGPKSSRWPARPAARRNLAPEAPATTTIGIAAISNAPVEPPCRVRPIT